MDVNREGYRAVSACAIAETGTVAWLREYGQKRGFRVVASDGDTEHWATNDVTMDATERLEYGELS